jgi:transcriptional regulator with XRE-family HTH domain
MLRLWKMHWLQKRLAHETGLIVGTISRIESNVNQGSLEWLRKIALALGITIDDISVW